MTGAAPAALPADAAGQPSLTANGDTARPPEAAGGEKAAVDAAVEERAAGGRAHTRDELAQVEQEVAAVERQVAEAERSGPR